MEYGKGSYAIIAGTPIWTFAVDVDKIGKENAQNHTPNSALHAYKSERPTQ